MPEPDRLMGQAPSNTGAEDPDADGEYEEDEEEYGQDGQADADGEPMSDVGSDVDAEGEDDDEEDYGEAVGAVKVAPPAEESSAEEDNSDGDPDVAMTPSSNAKTSDDDDSEESEAENGWQGESEDEEGPEAGPEASNACTFCNQNEEDDPSEEFEEYLTCVACGDHAHRQCARDANTLSSDDDASNWHCLACMQDALNSEREPSEPPSRRRLSSVPKLARDLLPSHRSSTGHSVFNEQILPDDPLDGSRSLRYKRKSPHDDPPSPRQTRKKRRSSEISRSERGPSMRSHTRTAPFTDNETEQGDDGHPSASEHGSTRLRSATTRTRPIRPKRAGGRPLCWVEEAAAGPSTPSLVIVFHVDNKKVQEIVSRKPKKKIVDPKVEARRERDRERRERNRRQAQQARAQSPEVSHFNGIQHVYAADQFHGFVEKDDEAKKKPYGGILSEADADTSKTYPTAADRKRFEDARLKAEDDWKQKQAALASSQEVTVRQPKQAVAASKIKCINFGGWEIDTWHAAPYPEEYSKNKVLYICEFCLKYMNSDYVAWRHKLKCPAKHPPGDEIYRDGKHSFFEVDGRKNPVYCQNLCLLAKLFLGSKTLYYDVEPFLFYVMTENDAYGCHFVGYFSKEKRPSSLNNVSCILVLPIHMRKGYGQYLIEFSYLLTRVEKKTGSPEKPLSDMGLVSYRKYWRLVLCQELLNQKGPITISAISERTGMTPDDIVSALEGLRALVRDPVTKAYALRLDFAYYKQYIEKCNANDNPKIKEECLIWTPYVMGRLGQYEDGPGISTVQQREDPDEEEKPTLEEGIKQMEIAPAKNGASDVPSPAGLIEEGGDANSLAPPAEEMTNGQSPIPGTPLANGSTVAIAGSQLSAANTPIPPTRYEIFPPIPGMTTAKRRPGRPFGSRRRTGTPSRTRSTGLAIATAPVTRMQRLSPTKNGLSPSANGPVTPSTISLRRTRSKLAQMQNGVNGDETPTGGEVRPLTRRGRTRSSTGSFADPNNQKGKGKGKPILTNGNGNGHDEDAPGESDVDAEGEMDVDAEGEYDDPEDVEMADA